MLLPLPARLIVVLLRCFLFVAGENGGRGKREAKGTEVAGEIVRSPARVGLRKSSPGAMYKGKEQRRSKGRGQKRVAVQVLLQGIVKIIAPILLT